MSSYPPPELTPFSSQQQDEGDRNSPLTLILKTNIEHFIVKVCQKKHGFHDEDIVTWSADPTVRL